ncbi:hypothetical protein PspLS_11296 [Pyricularia sp. CBS 133598]|nr:hypothetical protein PspLS_11296 [Pyricularia sp. CBS 133598]
MPPTPDLKFKKIVGKLAPSSSSNKEFPLEFAKRISSPYPIDIYIYYIDTLGLSFIDKRAQFRNSHRPYPFAEEDECIITSPVPWKKVIGWDKYDSVASITTYHHNEQYTGGIQTDDMGQILPDGVLPDEPCADSETEEHVTTDEDVNILENPGVPRGGPSAGPSGTEVEYEAIRIDDLRNKRKKTWRERRQ